MQEPNSYDITSTQTSAYISKINRTIDGKISNDSATVVEKITEIAQDYVNNIGSTVSNWEALQENDPAFSETFNQFWANVELDSLVLDSQLSVMEAAAIEAFNDIKMKILKSSYENSRLMNKLKTLQLYSSASDNSIIVFGDYFSSDEHVDKNITTAEMGDIDGTGVFSLSSTVAGTNPLKDAVIEVLSSSNGVPGNNQEITDNVPGLLGNKKTPEFMGITSRNSQLKMITDNQPSTWFEYENIKLSEQDMKNSEYLNYEYVDDINLISANTNDKKIVWGKGPKDGILKLDLLVKLKTPVVLNNFVIYSHEFKDKYNQPLRIKLISISSDGSTWVDLTPKDVLLTNNASVDDLSKNPTASIGEAKWKFDPQTIGQIKIFLEQDSPIETKIGHIFFKTKAQKKTTKVEKTGADGKKVVEYVESTIPSKRTLGPIPPISNPYKYYNQTSYSSTLESGVDVFKGERWVIALRDISVSEKRYALKSTLVSKAFNIPASVDRVMIESDIYIPESFDSDLEWVKFYVSPDNGLTWHRISRVQDVYNNVPEILVYNDPLPAEFRDPTAGYYNTPNVVNSLRVKIELFRPDNQPSYSPKVYGYKLKVRTRV